MIALGPERGRPHINVSDPLSDHAEDLLRAGVTREWRLWPGEATWLRNAGQELVARGLVEARPDGHARRTIAGYHWLREHPVGQLDDPRGGA